MKKCLHETIISVVRYPCFFIQKNIPSSFLISQEAKLVYRPVNKKRKIIGEDLSGEIGILKKFAKISLHQMNNISSQPLSFNMIAKLNQHQIVIFSKPPNIILFKISRFRVCPELYALYQGGLSTFIRNFMQNGRYIYNDIS